jgi:hypothetical protein
MPTKRATDKVIMEFLEENIFTRFGVPSKITTDNANAFNSIELSTFCFDYGIVLSHSNYYPQGNGLAKSSNKNLMTIIKKMVGDNMKIQDSKIKYALWDDRITKDSTRKSPFELVYEMERAHLTLEDGSSLEDLKDLYKILQQFSSDQDAVQNRIN